MALLEFLDLPEHIQVGILQKLDALSFVRHLKTCRGINNLANARRKKLRFPLENVILALDFDNSARPVELPNQEYKISYAFRKMAFRLGLEVNYNFVYKTYEVSVEQMLQALPSISFFHFQNIRIGDELFTDEAMHAAKRVIALMGELQMRTEDLEMYNSGCCSLALEVLQPKYFRLDYCCDRHLKSCISIDQMSRLELFDYFSSDADDCKEVLTEILPNCPYSELFTNVGFDSWSLLLGHVQKVRRGQVLNRRLNFGCNGQTLPELSDLFSACNIPHRIYSEDFRDEADPEDLSLNSPVFAVFTPCTFDNCQVAIISRKLVHTIRFCLKIVASFQEFEEFYSERMQKGTYDFCPEIEQEVFNAVN